MTWERISYRCRRCNSIQNFYQKDRRNVSSMMLTHDTRQPPKSKALNSCLPRS